MVRFFFAAVAAFLMFFLAADFCFALAMIGLRFMAIKMCACASGLSALP
jgi:hypothetical protein